MFARGVFAVAAILQGKRDIVRTGGYRIRPYGTRKISIEYVGAHSICARGALQRLQMSHRRAVFARGVFAVAAIEAPSARGLPRSGWGRET